MFSSCHNVTDNGGLLFLEWPDGKPYLEQDNIVFEMFSTIKEAFYEDAKRKLKKQERKLRNRRG